MDSLPGAASLARGLLVLARSRASGVLTVRTTERTARIAVRGGRVIALTVTPDDGDPIGEALRRMGAWDEAVVEPEAPKADEPFGLWASRAGLTDPAAVSLALRKQMLRRMARLFAEEVPELELRAGSPKLGVPVLDEPPTTAELLVSAVRARMQDVPLISVRRKLGDGMLVLTPLGRELLEGAALWPDEQAVVTLLGRGASVDDLISAAGGSPRAQRTLHGLRLLGATGPPRAQRAGYALLLQKKRAVERRARDLLELPPTASARDRRRALRRLATKLHPDRFDADPEAAIRAASHSVMSALHAAR